jgi:hypothetical protein
MGKITHRHSDDNTTRTAAPGAETADPAGPVWLTNAEEGLCARPRPRYRKRPRAELLGADFVKCPHPRGAVGGSAEPRQAHGARSARCRSHVCSGRRRVLICFHMRSTDPCRCTCTRRAWCQRRLVHQRRNVVKPTPTIGGSSAVFLERATPQRDPSLSTKNAGGKGGFFSRNAAYPGMRPPCWP